MDYIAQAGELDALLKKIFGAKKRKRLFESIEGGGFILFFLNESETPVTPGILSAKMNISTARIAKALNCLEDKGLIHRSISTEDRRQINVELTTSGKELALKAKAEHTEYLASIMKSLGEEDTNTLLAILKRISLLRRDD